jgi:NADP-dependent 3-hydroxy acid dehydrogenase YdfG
MSNRRIRCGSDTSQLVGDAEANRHDRDFLPLDVREAQSISRAAQAVSWAEDHLDILVHNAGLLLKEARKHFATEAPRELTEKFKRTESSCLGESRRNLRC